MKNNYILDTSVLIDNPLVYTDYKNSVVIIPIAVLNELDNLKKQSSEAGKFARVAIRKIDELSEKGNLNQGILIDNNILIKVDTNFYNLNDKIFQGFGDPTYGDTQILACAYSIWITNKKRNTILLTNDINLRIKAKSRGLEAQSSTKNQSFDDLYSGIRKINNVEAGTELLQNEIISASKFNLNDLCFNECLIFENENWDEISLGRYLGEDKIKLVKKQYPWSISPRNTEQIFAIDLVMDKNLQLITLSGIAGTGKNIVSIAAALELVLHKKEYDKLIIYRPIQEVGKDLGYLPGEVSEKLAFWFQATQDTFEVLFSSKSGVGDWKKNLELYQKKNKIEFEAITYIRGRSIPRALIIVDEAQNLSSSVIKSIVSRAGENSKVILLGDIEQIDDIKLSAVDNALTHVIENFKDHDIYGHMTLVKGERSKLATLAANLL